MKMMIAVIVALVCIQTVCAVDPLSVQVNCRECSEQDGYKFYADAGKSVTLTASSNGGIGSKSYSWTKEGSVVCEYASFALTVAEDNVEYILTVTDNRGSVKKTIEIVPIFSQESKCLPGFIGEIIVTDRVSGREEYSVGDILTARIRIDTRDCPNSDYQFYWMADDENIIFTEPDSTKTEVRIGQGTKNGNVEIEAIITNGKIERSCDVEIEIVSNTPPEFGIEHSEPVCSYTRFDAYCVDFKPGKRGESGDFLHSCSAVLKNEGGEIVSSVSRTASRGKVSSLRLKPEEIGIYFIEMTVEDSHGAATTMNKTIQVTKGNTGKDIPVVRAPDTIYCIVNEVCRIDASETTRRDKYVSNFRFYNVATKEQLVNPAGHYYSGSVCNHIFTYPGTYRIRIEANYFDEDNIGSKIVTVIVSSGNVFAPTPTPTATPTSIAVSRPVVRETIMPEEPEIKEEGFKKFFQDIIDIIKNALNF